VAAPPYDVINTAEARELTRDNPASYLFVSRPEVSLPEGTDEHSDAVYAQGKKNLTRLIADGALVQDPEPRMYLYEQKMGDHTQVGVVACASVSEYERDLIKKHEKTRPEKEDDRTRHIRELGAHDEPVFLTYRAKRDVDAVVARGMKTAPVYDMETDDGVRHKLWMLSQDDSLALAKTFERVSALYVADGHHRSAAAARVHGELSGDGGEHDVFLAVVFPDDQMNILAYNRLVRDPAGRSSEELLTAIRETMKSVEPASSPIPEHPRTFGLYIGGQWYLAKMKDRSFDLTDPVAPLDVSICQDQILGPIFDVKDPRRDKHVDFVGGIRGAAELERRVDSGEFSLAVYLHPTQIEELMKVSDAGRLMPPKSTWFEPKLRSGLFVHVF